MKQVLLLPSSRIESHPIQLLTRRTPSAMSALLIKAQCLLYVQFLVPIYFALTRYTLRMIKFVYASHDFLFRKKLYLISRLEIRRALDIAKKDTALCALYVCTTKNYLHTITTTLLLSRLHLVTIQSGSW